MQNRLTFNFETRSTDLLFGAVKSCILLLITDNVDAGFDSNSNKFDTHYGRTPAFLNGRCSLRGLANTPVHVNFAYGIIWVLTGTVG